MDSFIYEAQQGRVVFGIGKMEEARAEVENLGGERALVISTPGRKNLALELKDILGDVCAGIHAKAVQHVPIETVTEALQVISDLEIDILVPIGGGSSIGLAKAIALKTGLPIIAIPTTYAGSEMSSIWGMTEDNVKRTGKDLVVKPKTVIYDPKLTFSLPAHLTVTSGMNAIAHCAEGLYAEHANPIISLFAEEGIRALCSSLPKLTAEPTNEKARSEALYGCWLGGTVLGSVGVALHHKLCHVLGGSFNLPHAETHTVILPYALSYNASHAPEAMKAFARAFRCNVNDVAGSLFDFTKSLGVPTSLAELGMKRSDIPQAAVLATKNPYYNPRPIEQQAIEQLIEEAYIGERPQKASFIRIPF